VPVRTYDLKSERFFADPYPTYAAMRADDPVYRQPETGIWFLTRYDDIADLCRNPSLGNDRTPAFFPAQNERITAETATVRRFVAPWIVFLDPPEHTRIRSILARAFTPRAIEALRPVVQKIVDAEIEALRSRRGDADLVRDFAFPVPAQVIGHMLGLPPEDLPQFRAWVGDVFSVPGMMGDQEANIRAAHAAIGHLEDYIRRLIARRRAAPGDDLVSILIAADAEGRLLTEQELVSTCALLLIAGHETTTHTIGNGVIALLRHPDQLAALRGDPGLLGSAVEEMLRYDSSTGMLGRTALADVEYGRQAIPAGSLVFGVAHAANRDPAVFADPDRFDIARRPTRQLGFGHGIHICLGAALARLEAEVAIGTLVRALPELAPVSDDYDWIPSFALRGVRSLPVTL
jgi:cytochrome P450